MSVPEASVSDAHRLRGRAKNLVAVLKVGIFPVSTRLTAFYELLDDARASLSADMVRHLDDLRDRDPNLDRQEDAAVLLEWWRDRLDHHDEDEGEHVEEDRQVIEPATLTVTGTPGKAGGNPGRLVTISQGERAFTKVMAKSWCDVLGGWARNYGHHDSSQTKEAGRLREWLRKEGLPDRVENGLTIKGDV